MSANQETENTGARRRGLTLIAIVVAVGAVAWGGWHWVKARHHESTDNAYVAGNVVQITPQLAGTVVAIEADDTDFVKAGQVLVRLDAADAQVALKQARAALAETVREVRTLYAGNATLAAQVALREADVGKAQAALSSAQDDVKRRQPLVASGAVGKEEAEHASARLAGVRSELAAAESALLAARESLQANQARTEGTTVEQHPSVQRAAAKVREAWLAMQRVELVAPVNGHIAKRGVQLGQRVQAGAPLMTVVALDRLWVDANFKESQLRALRIGQPAVLEADVYGSKVAYHGTVVGMAAGTGAAFALLPAQNATGNWVKVVQRVPVRIALDPKEVTEHPLRVGLSMEVSVDTEDQSGAALAQARQSTPQQATPLDEPQTKVADADVLRIITANLGQPVKSAAPAKAGKTQH